MKRKLWLIAALILGVSSNIYAENVYTIYPIPQEQLAVNGTAKFTNEVNVVCESAIDQYTKDRLTSILSEKGLTTVFSETAAADKANIYLGVNGSNGVADQLATSLNLSRSVFSQNKYDRHCLSLQSEADGRAQLLVLGENTDAVFIALASLEYMLDGGYEAMPCVTIYDYADQMSRGLIEGFYGYAYSVTVKKDLMRFMMRHKMNTYMYGVKGDPYHAGYWKDAYPTSITAEQEKNGYLTQDMLKELAEESHKTKVNFIWAIHPGNEFLGSNSVVSDIMKKFEMMYDLGLRQFAVFVDDVSIPNSQEGYDLNAQRVTDIQRSIEEKWNKSYTSPSDTVKPLHFVPQIYCNSFAGSAQQYADFFTALAATPQNVTIYTTGQGVWSVPNAGDLASPKSYLGRDVAWWWNYPCNDNADGQIYPMDMYSNFYDMPAVGNNATLPANLENCRGIISNPMQEGEVAKIPLFSVADYAWNNSGFNNMESWSASFKAIVGEQYAKDYQELAYYLRYNDPEALKNEIAAYKSAFGVGNPQPDALKTRLGKVYDACVSLGRLETSEKESDKLLYADLRPYLQKLTGATRSVLAFLDAASASDKAEKWGKYVGEVETASTIDTDEAYKTYALEGMGTNVSISEHNAKVSQNYLLPFVTYMKENALASVFNVGTTGDPKPFTNVDGLKLSVRKSSKGEIYMVQNELVLRKGEYVGFELPNAYKETSLIVADTLLDNYTVLYSLNGKDWKKAENADLSEEYVKYVSILNETEATKTLKVVKNTLNLTIPQNNAVVASSSVPSGEQEPGCSKEALYDGDLSTYCIVRENQENGDQYTLTLSNKALLTDVRIYIATTNGDYPKRAKVEVSSDNRVWTPLKVAGTNKTDFTFNDGTVVGEQFYVDFETKNVEAIYLRLVVVEKPSSNKWFRIAEIQVNKNFDEIFTDATCQSATGMPLQMLYDVIPYTGMSDLSFEGKELIYQLRSLKAMKELIFYHGNIAEGTAKIQITEDGETWNDFGSLSGVLSKVDLSANPEAKMVKVSWSGENPPIYEIEEVLDESSMPVISDIEKIEFIQGELGLEIKDGRLMINGNCGIENVKVYNTRGQLLFSMSAGASKVLQLPNVKTDGVLIISASSTDGTRSTAKVVLK